MAKRPDYEFITEIETPKQKKSNGLAKKLLSDMKRIDAVVATGDFSQLKSLHVELDGTYQNRIKNWGYSMYNYIPDTGFTYNYISDDTIRENLVTMKGKIRGLLFEIDPNAEENMEKENATLVDQPLRMNAKQRKLIADYAQIKQKTSGNMAITIQAEEYPRYKDTLDYMLEYEYITKIDVDFGTNHLYFKQPSFDSFAEIVMTQEMEEEPMVTEYSNKKVFIVHGHDEQLLQEVELMIHRIGLQPIILKNEASGGRTVIEKIERYTDVGFGIVLYTACDEGRVKGATNFNRRARQNVVFEHGYLCAKLSRSRVVALNDSGIEVPSDLAGVVYISREASDWKSQIMREMREAGLEFDSTRA